MGRPGQPTKLTDESRKMILQAIELGASYEDAAIYGGICYQTFLNWRKRANEQQSGQYFEFFEALRASEARGKIACLAHIRGAAKKDWRAAAWTLERRDPDGYALTQKHRHGGDPDAPPIETRGAFTILIDSRRDEDADSDRTAEPE